MLLSKLFLLATASLGACSILPTHLSNNTNTTTHLLDPRSNPGTHEGVFKGYDCEGPFGARCDLKRRKSEQGEIGKANSTQLNKCLIDLSRATDPKRPGLSKDQKNYSKSHWNNGGWICGDRVFQMGSTRHKKHFPHTIWEKCMSTLAVAADEGRDWFRCTVTSSNGVTRRHWISWSPMGCRNGHKRQKKPECSEEYARNDKFLDTCMDPPCEMVNGINAYGKNVHGTNAHAA